MHSAVINCKSRLSLYTASIVFLSMTNIPSTLTPIDCPFKWFRNMCICENNVIRQLFQLSNSCYFSCIATCFRNSSYLQQYWWPVTVPLTKLFQLLQAEFKSLSLSRLLSDKTACRSIAVLSSRNICLCWRHL